jgi:hypothetical protein
MIRAMVELQEVDQAKDICLNFLNHGGYTEAEKNEALRMLAKMYTLTENHEKAARAFAGLFDAF